MAGQKSIAERTSKFFALQLRLLSALQLLSGAGYIGFACVLQFPPGDQLTLGLWLIGCLTILTSLLGCLGGCRVRCCLGAYLTLAVLATLAQSGFVIYLFVSPESAVSKLSDYQKIEQGTTKAHLHNIVFVGRWVLLGLLSAQLLAIAISLLLRCCLRGRQYSEFVDEEQAAYAARQQAASQQMQQLKSKVLREEPLAGEGADAKRALSISAVAGGAPSWQRPVRASEQQRIQSLFREDTSEAKLAGEAEEGKIGASISSDATAADARAWLTGGAAAAPAWAAAPPPQQSPPRPFRPNWSRSAAGSSK